MEEEEEEGEVEVEEAVEVAESVEMEVAVAMRGVVAWAEVTEVVEVLLERAPELNLFPALVQEQVVERIVVVVVDKTLAAADNSLLKINDTQSFC